jgi:acyl-coenzyme A synthetase/AMP-(fatty) acid ligase
MASATKNNALLERWAGTLQRCRNRPAIHDASGAVARTFEDVETESRQIAGILPSLPEGSVMGVQLANSPSWPALLVALLRRRFVPLPLGIGMHEHERNEALATCCAGGVVVLRGKRLVFEPSGGVYRATDCDFLKLTSGTTSAPRAIRFRAHQLAVDCDNVCDTMGITDADLNFGVVAFSHSYGFSNLITPLLCRGVPIVASEDTLPRAMLAQLANSGATVFPGTPVFYQSLAELENIPPLPALRLCISAGAPLPPRAAAKFSQKFGRKIHTFYGASECGGIGYDRGDSLDYEAGFLGSPMNGVQIEQRKDATIEVRGEAVGDGYFPEDDTATLDGKRFVPADLVHCTERGMYLAGRVADVINVAGRKLNPLEAETKLQSCPGLRQVVVFGVPSPHRNESVIACVAGTLGAEDFLRFARSQLSAWQVPKDVWIVEGIPMDERGKINRRELAQRYLAARKATPTDDRSLR